MLTPSSGIGVFAANSEKVIRFVRYGCANRPFYHIVVAEVGKGIIVDENAVFLLFLIDKKGAVHAGY